jgi:hypothetical protein
MSSRTLLCLLAGLSIGWSVSAQTPVPKPKPARKPAIAKPATAPKPVEKTAAVVPPAPPPPPTDLKIRTKYVSGPQISENTTYFKGVRQRFEFPGITMITQCDLKRSVQLQDATKHFMVVSTDTPAPAVPAASNAGAGNTAGTAAPKGGVVSESITLTDTGERKQMFGLEARHIKTAIVRQPGENACESKTTRVETDGWYADLPAHATCDAAPPPAPAPAAPTGAQACTDRVETRRTGDAQLGFALSTTMTTTVESGKDGKDKDVTAMSVEVTELIVTSLDAGLFDAPKDYTEVQNYQQLLPTGAAGGSLADAIFGSLADGTSTVAPKKAGVIRIGVVEPANSSGREMASPMLRGQLLGTLNKAPFEAVPIWGPNAAAVDRDAADKACDYVLVSDITELKTSKPNKVGGMLRRASGDGNASENVHDARVDYRLYAVGDQNKPRLTASAKSSSGGFGVGSALRVAAFAGQMYMTMGMGTGMMSGMMGPAAAFGGVSPLGGGLMSPGMGAAMSIMSGAQSMGAMGMGMGMPGGLPGGDASTEKATQTVHDALAKAGKQVAEEIKTGKLRPTAAK